MVHLFKKQSQKSHLTRRMRSVIVAVSLPWLLSLHACSLIFPGGSDVIREPGSFSPHSGLQIVAAPTTQITRAWPTDTKPVTKSQHELSCTFPVPGSLLRNINTYPTPTKALKAGQTSFPFVREAPQSELRNPSPPNPANGHTSVDREGRHQSPPQPGSDPNTSGRTPSKTRGVSSPKIPKTQEADIVRLRGNQLFILSKRGLLLFDITNLEKPRQMSQFPLPGKPVELFVEQERAFVFVEGLKEDPQQTISSKSYSALLSIDIKQPETPKLISQARVIGRLWQGATKKRKDAFYTVSYLAARTEKANCTVAEAQYQSQLLVSVLKADPQGKLSLQSSTQILQDEMHPNTGFQSVTVTMTDKAFLVAEYREGWSTIGNCKRSIRQQTVANIFFINDSDGSAKLASRFSFEGFLTDQHKQSITTDNEGTRHYQAILQVRAAKHSIEREFRCIQGRLLVANRLITVSLKEPRFPILSKTLEIGNLTEEVSGSLFDHSRRLLYAITTKTDKTTGSGGAVKPNDSVKNDVWAPPGKDPLYVIDLSTPQQPKIMSTIDGLDGEINFFQPIKDGGFLIAIGRDRTGHCTGFLRNTDAATDTTRVAVSVLDVRQPNAARLVQRRCFGFPGLNSAIALQNQDQDQEHKQVGLATYEDGNRALLGLPIQFLSTFDGKKRTAIGMMDIHLVPWSKGTQPDTALCKTCLTLREPALLNTPAERVVFQPISHPKQPPSWVLGLSKSTLTIADLQRDKTPTLSSVRLDGEHFVLAGGSAIITQNADRSRTIVITSDTTSDTKEIELKNLRSWFVWKGHLLLQTLILSGNHTNVHPQSHFETKLQVFRVKNGKIEASAPLRLPPPVFNTNANKPQRIFPSGLKGSQSKQTIHTSTGIFTWSDVITKAQGKPTAFFINLLKPMKPALQQWTIKAPDSEKRAITDIGFVSINETKVLLSYAAARNRDVVGYTRRQEILSYAQPLRWDGNEWKQDTPLELPGTLLGVYGDENKRFFLTAYNQGLNKSMVESGYARINRDSKEETHYTEEQFHLQLSVSTGKDKVQLIQSIPLNQWDLEEISLQPNTDPTTHQLTLTLRPNWFSLRAKREQLKPEDMLAKKRELSLSANGFQWLP